jgi:serine kinase of HPr protein (carbohydrate metabolism regulator)
MADDVLHMSCVAIRGRAVLIAGRSGRGKSDLALRLIDRGAALVSDDYTRVRVENGRLLAAAPPNISGKMEARGIGILEFPVESDVPVALCVDLDGEIERMPAEGETRRLAGLDVPLVHISALEASAPIKVEAALRMVGHAR